MSEEIEAKRDNANLQPNSGRGSHRKADALLDDLSIDYKESNKTFGLSRSVWAKTSTDAMTNGLDMNPVLKVVLGARQPYTRLAVIDWEYLMYLKNIEQEYRRQHA